MQSMGRNNIKKREGKRIYVQEQGKLEVARRTINNIIEVGE